MRWWIGVRDAMRYACSRSVRITTSNDTSRPTVTIRSAADYSCTCPVNCGQSLAFAVATHSANPLSAGYRQVIKLGYRPVTSGSDDTGSRAPHEPLQEQPARPRVQPLRGVRAPTAAPGARAGPVRRHRRRHRPQHPGRDRPAGPRRPRRELRRRRPQPAGLRPGHAQRAAAADRSTARTRRSWTAEFWRLDLPAELGGTPRPADPVVVLRRAGARAPTRRSGCTRPARPSRTRCTSRARPEQKEWAKLFVEKQWASTMVLTEPDAGSDVGAGRTRAIPQPDGSWHIEGVKRFITSGEHDLTDNIIHYVLARPVGVDGRGGPGTKGLSLFIVPKFHFDPETGELGERNGVFATNVEHKMGLKVSNTCELTFGEHGVPAKGWLLGDVHEGIRQMFLIIEYARMMVGTKAIATLSTGYLNALEYAKSRVQGADLLRQGDKTAPARHDHPPPRRAPLAAAAEVVRRRAARAGALHRAAGRTRSGWPRTSGDEATAKRRPDGSTTCCCPLVKGVRLGAGLRAARPRVAADLRRLRLPAGLPAGAVRPGREDRHPVRGYDRDPESRPDLPQDRQGRRGRRWASWSSEIQSFLETEPRQRPAQGGAALPGRRVGDAQGMLGTVIGWLGGGRRRRARRAVQGRPDLPPGPAGPGRPGRRLAAAAPGRGRAGRPRAGEVSAADKAFYDGKVAAARFFAREVLPRLAATAASSTPPPST